MVGLMTENGTQKEVRVPLDFEAIGPGVADRLTREQSIAMINLIEPMSNALDSIYHWVAAVHLNREIDPFSKELGAVAANLVADDKALPERDKDRYVNRIGREMDQFKKEVDKMDWLSADEKKSFFREICGHVFELNRGFSIAYLTVGHEKF